VIPTMSFIFYLSKSQFLFIPDDLAVTKTN
jgi:hypothetical protein